MTSDLFLPMIAPEAGAGRGRHRRGMVPFQARRDPVRAWAQRSTAGNRRTGEGVGAPRPRAFLSPGRARGGGAEGGAHGGGCVLARAAGDRLRVGQKISPRETGGRGGGVGPSTTRDAYGILLRCRSQHTST